jgi:hypothetical protein
MPAITARIMALELVELRPGQRVDAALHAMGFAPTQPSLAARSHGCNNVWRATS